MNRIFLVVLAGVMVYSCSPKIATKQTARDFQEDLSQYRPLGPDISDIQTPVQDPLVNKGPYVAPSHDINRQMNVALDSIISANKSKTYLIYTIQVYLGRSREEANQVRERLYRIMPAENPELNYRQPSWRVTVGKYFDRVDAYKTLNMLKQAFPGALLVPERIPLN